MNQNKGFSYPTEQIPLPSKGIIYPESSPLSSGFVDVKYMGAKEEDILTNTRLLESGNTIQKLLESVLVTPGVRVDDLIAGDKDALILTTRIFGFGKDYSFSTKFKGDERKVNLDLSTIEYKEIDETLFKKGINEFEYEVPETKTKITFKILTGHDEKKIKAENDGLRKLNPNHSGDISTTLKYSILAVNGNRDSAFIRNFIDAPVLIAFQSRKFRNYIDKISPGVNFKFDYTFEDGEVMEGFRMPMTVDFFWPDFAI